MMRLAAVCDCATPWTFLLTSLQQDPGWNLECMIIFLSWTRSGRTDVMASSQDPLI